MPIVIAVDYVHVCKSLKTKNNRHGALHHQVCCCLSSNGHFERVWTPIDHRRNIYEHEV